ncbi:DUF4097 family beta strand repeat-containing protein [Paenibacillus woosongensis]|uniref:DUF4097 domain-containing protein n=1 Tax=Paenibacillus woosongensis TaxID=307580 RepID=A0A7X3CL79_9BACL|nr:DUF4097 family beta strand repeat-containing protein [Paenibacillus woosongensis]MUG44113.1 hypothetical protein [Paenibacillus woosongensis]
MSRIRNKHRSRLNSITMTAAAVTLAMLAGCGIQDKSDEVIVQAASSLEQSVIPAADKWGQRSKEAGLFREISAYHQMGKATRLSVDHTVGNIKISAYDGEEIRVHAVVWFGKSTQQESRQRILDQAEVSVIDKGELLRIVTHPKDEPDSSLWKWAEKKYGFSDFMIDYEIEVPEVLESYDIRHEVGNIELHDLKGSYSIHSEIGQVKLNNVRISGRSSVATSTGSVDVSIAELSGQGQLNVQTEIGNIHAALGDAVECTLVIKNDVGKITGAAEGTSQINGGGGEILLQTQVGSIMVE